VDVDVDVDGAQPTALHAESYRMSEDDEGVFGFEKLDVYQRAVEFLAVAARLVQELPPQSASVGRPAQTGSALGSRERRRGRRPNVCS
jgi:hypothetical protein